MHKPLSHRTRQGGAVAIIVALSIAVLIGFGGLALDSGQLFVSKTELQNAADACALSASAALTGASVNQLDIAENWGKAAGQANRVGFQNAGILVTSSDVTFSENLQGPYFTKGTVAPADAVKMKFAKCTLNRTGIKTWFIQVLNLLPSVAIGDQRVASMGAATLRPSQTTCALPVAICKAKVDLIKPGDWIKGVVDGSDNISGEFQWVNYVKGGSGKSIKDMLTNKPVCNLSNEEKVGAPGSKVGATAAWNTRFGIYKGAYKGPDDGVPDFTGYAYTPASWWANATTERGNAYNGDPLTLPLKAPHNFKEARAKNDPFDPITSGINIQPKGNGNNITILDTPTKLAEYGSDRRLGIVPVVDCTELEPTPGSGSVKEATIKSFACILMLHPLEQNGGGAKAGTRMYLEYLGPASSLTSPCASVGLPGNSTSVGPLVPALVQ